MEHSTLTRKGQTTIPAHIRERLGLQPGDRILYEERGDEIVLRVHPGVAAVSGMLKHRVQRQFDGDFEAERLAAQEAWAQSGMDILEDDSETENS